MSVKKYVDYYKDNPENFWFKKKVYGWGWVPVKWQGWLVLAVSLIIFIIGYYIGEINDSPGLILISVFIMLAFLILFGYWKGEKPHWQWGLKGN